MTESRPRHSPPALQTALQQVCSSDRAREARDPRRVRQNLPRPAGSPSCFVTHRSSAHDDERPDLDRSLTSDPKVAADVIDPAVEISPPGVAIRQTVMGDWMAAEFVHSAGPSNLQYHFRAPVHLLVMHEKGERRDGETFVEGLPRSTLRNVAQKLTFVPAGHEYHEWHELGTHTRRVHFYFDAEKLKLQLHVPDRPFAPRLFFEDATLWHTALKLKSLLESPASSDQLYFELLSTLLVHELVRLNRGMTAWHPELRGGLAPWQQRIVSTYLEEHFDEDVPVSRVAQLARLSRYHFSRAFKQSFGTTPRRFQTNCRIEHAKLLLADRAVSVTEIGMQVGFSSSASFATAFRKATGFTPTAYRRSLAESQPLWLTRDTGSANRGSDIPLKDNRCR
jgi:AraC family transcriptional regulator